MTDYSGDEDRSGKGGAGEPAPMPKSAYETLAPASGARAARRSRQSRNQFVVFLNFLVSGVVLLTIATGFGIYIGKQIFDGKGPSTQDAVFMVKPKTGANAIAGDLEERGLVSDAQIFRIG